VYLLPYRTAVYRRLAARMTGPMLRPRPRAPMARPA